LHDQHDGVNFMAKVKPAAHRDARKASKQDTPRRKTSGTMGTATPVSSQSEMAVEDQLMPSSFSLHELFQQQTRQMLDRADLNEEQKQEILVAMSCPCCGAGAMSFTAKLRR
jgi:hypothetical protein